MGCGSSSTNVQAFRNPEENKNYQKQKAPSRQSSAVTSVRSQSSVNKKNKTSKRKSSASSSSSSAGSRRQSKSDEETRINSAITKKAYLIQRPNSDVTHNYTPLPVAPHGENENIQTSVETFENEFEKNESNEKILEAQRHHEVIQKQTFITGDPEDEPHVKSKEQNETRAESHEEIFRRKEKKRSQYDFDKLEEDRIKEDGLVAITIPEMDNGDKNIEYTIDDIIAHNDEVGGQDWFKYGRKIYSCKKMRSIIQGRVDQYRGLVENGAICRWGDEDAMVTYPIYVARRQGVSRKELLSVLAVCQIGICVEIPREERLSRMKQSAESVVEEDADSAYFKEYRSQLERWLADYPMNKVYNDPPNPQTDPNEMVFPLPPDIQADPDVLRKWIETWTVFDCDVPEEGAWSVAPLLKDDWGDTHEVYALVVQEHHDDGSLEPLDMTIDGDVAWVELELDLLKNDTTTESQEAIWKKRATRTNLNDPEWMKNRREELAMALKKRYDLRQIEYPVENYMSFADTLEQHWKQFQELCEKEFVFPNGNFKKTKESKLAMDDHQKIDGGDVIVTDGEESENERNTDRSHIDQNPDTLIVDHETREQDENCDDNRLDLEGQNKDVEKTESEDRGDESNRLVINDQNGVHEQGAIDPVNDVGADDILGLETMDSGLELDTGDSHEHGSVEQDIGKTNGDSIQLNSRPGSTENGKY